MKCRQKYRLADWQTNRNTENNKYRSKLYRNANRQICRQKHRQTGMKTEIVASKHK